MIFPEEEDTVIANAVLMDDAGGWGNVYTDRQTDRWKCRQIDGQTQKRIDGHSYRQTFTDTKENGRMDGCRDRHTKRSMDGWTCRQTG